MSVLTKKANGLTPMQDKYCEFVAQGFTYARSAELAGYKMHTYDPVPDLMKDVAILRAICDRIRIYKREVASVELLSKSKRKLNELMDSEDPKVSLGASSAVIRTFSSPGGKTLLEKALEEDQKVYDLATLAKSLLPNNTVITVEAEPILLPEDAGDKEH